MRLIVNPGQCRRKQPERDCERCPCQSDLQKIDARSFAAPAAQFLKKKQRRHHQKRRAAPGGFDRSSTLPFSPSPNDFLIQLLLRLVRSQTCNANTAYIGLRREPPVSGFWREPRQVHPDLPFVIDRKDEAVGQAQKKQHVLSIQVLMQIGWEQRPAREKGSVFGMTP